MSILVEKEIITEPADRPDSRKSKEEKNIWHRLIIEVLKAWVFSNAT